MLDMMGIQDGERMEVEKKKKIRKAKKSQIKQEKRRRMKWVMLIDCFDI